MEDRPRLRQTAQLSPGRRQDDPIQSATVTRDGKRPLAALVAMLILAALLSACGDSDSGSDSSAGMSTGAGATTSTTGNGDEASKGGSSAESKSEDGSKQGKREDEGDDSGSRSPDVATPLEVSGGGSAQFRTKGGDNSIQEYGDEGDESELQEVAEIVHRFYIARAEEKWDTACSYLAKPNIEQLEQLGSQSPKFKDAGCGPILEAFTRPLPPAVQREITTIDAGSFRHDGEQGFLIYTGAGRTVYAMPLRDEDGSWKVAALSASAIG